MKRFSCQEARIELYLVANVHTRTFKILPLGDLKLVEKPSPLTLAPHDFANIKANVKVASTENGIIFGNIGERITFCTSQLLKFVLLIVNRACFPVCSLFPVYDVSGAASDRNCVVLSDIHIDIMDYIQPASCTDAEFRQMWAEFEWENKVKSACIFTLEKRL